MVQHNLKLARESAGRIYAKEAVGEGGVVSNLQRKLQSAELNLSQEERLNAQTRLLDIKRDMRILLNITRENEDEGTVFKAVALMQKIASSLQNPNLKWFAAPLKGPSVLAYALREGLAPQHVERLNDFLADVLPFGKSLNAQFEKNGMDSIELVLTQNEVRPTEIGAMAHLRRMFEQARLDFSKLRNDVFAMSQLDLTDLAFAQSIQYQFVFRLQPKRGESRPSTEASMSFTTSNGKKYQLTVNVEKSTLIVFYDKTSYNLSDEYRV